MKRRTSQTAGFTLVEVMVATAVLALALGACLLSFSMAMKSVGTARGQMEALHLARQELERLRTLTFTNSALSAGTYAVTNGSYTVTALDSHTKNISVQMVYRNYLRGGNSTNTVTTTLVRTLHP